MNTKTSNDSSNKTKILNITTVALFRALWIPH
jgi:hypothetical protein